MINNGSQTEGKEQGILKTGMIKKGGIDCESISSRPSSPRTGELVLSHLNGVCKLPCNASSVMGEALRRNGMLYYSLRCRQVSFSKGTDYFYFYKRLNSGEAMNWRNIKVRLEGLG